MSDTWVKPTPAALRSLAVLFAINILNFYDRQTPGALAEPIRKEFGLSDTQLGALSTLFTVLYAIVGLPLGRLADRASRKLLLAAGVTIWSALTGSAAFAASYTGLMFSRLGVAVGEAVCAPTATSWIGDLFPAERRSKALALFMMGVPLGSAISFTLGGPIAQAYGWRIAMIVAAAPAVLLVPALLSITEPRRGASETSPGERASSTGKAPPIQSVLRIRTLWWIIASGALVNFNLYALGTFLPAFLTRFHGFTVAQSGFWSGLAHGIAGVCGGLIAGAWGDRIIRYRADGRLLSASCAALLAAPFAFFAVLQPAGTGAAALVLIGFAYGLLNMYYGFVYSAIQDIVVPELRGATMAIYFLAMYLCGASFGPLLTGRLSDHLARRAAAEAGLATLNEAARAIGLHQAMYVIPALSLALAAVLFAGSRTVAGDMLARGVSTIGMGGPAHGS